MKHFATVLSIFLLAFYGCSSSSSSNEPKTGHAVGSIIDHLPYKCGTYTGKTGRLGNFTYMPGSDCTFAIGKMSFTVSPYSLYKGYVTVYDMVSTKEEAWTLMAIIQSISYTRPGTDLILIIDGNLEKRIPVVDLKNGDSAVAEALKTFAGTVKAVSVQAAKERLGKTVRQDNTLAITREEIIAQGKAILDSLGLHEESGKQWFPNKNLKETNHDNRVNFRFYDNYGNPLLIISSYFSYTTHAYPDPSWLWVTDGQNPTNSIPIMGSTQGDLTGPNIMGIDFYAGRSASTQPATAFYNSAFDGPMATPMALFAYGAHPSQNTNNTYPQELNFGFQMNLSGASFSYTALPNSTPFGGVYQNNFYCPLMQIGQGSTSASWTTYLDVIKDLGETIFDGFEVYESGGTSIKKDISFLKSFTDFIKALFDLATQNWWVVAVNTNIDSYRISYQGNPATIMKCWISNSNTTVVPVIIYSTYDDHTFDIVVNYPGQSINGITIQ